MDLANQAPIFEGSSENAVNPVTSQGSSQIIDIPDAPHKDTTVHKSTEPPQRPQAKAAQQVISNITAPTNEPITTPPDPSTAPPSMSSRGRQRIVSSRMKYIIEAGEFKSSMFNTLKSTYYTKHDIYLELQYKMSNPMAFLTDMQGETMYFHQAMAQEESGDFVEAAVNEVNGYVENAHWKLVPTESFTENTNILPSVWSTQREKNIVTNKITKYKTRLNVHGGNQTFGEKYFDPYSSVVTWFSIRLLIICAIVLNWQLRRVDSIMAYAQASIECDIYLHPPDGIETKSGKIRTQVLKLLRNVYDQKQSGKVWANFLSENLFKIGFERSNIDECVFYRGNLVFLVYVDDIIFVSLDGT